MRTGSPRWGLLYVPCGWCGKRVQETESGRRRGCVMDAHQEARTLGQ